MGLTIRARFAHGVLKPLEDVRLREGDEVFIRIEEVCSVPGVDSLEQTAGGWRDLVDADELKRRIEESRLLLTRLQPRL